MRKEIVIIIYLIFCLGFTAGCLPDSAENLDSNLSTIPPMATVAASETEIELEPTMIATPTTTPLPMPTETPAPTQIATGELHVFSEPEGALALIASEELNAQTPLTWTILPGTYTVTFALDGYHEWTTPITVTAGSQVTLTAALRQQHTIIPIEGASHAWTLVWSDDGQSLTYATSDVQWPPHVQVLSIYQSWRIYDLTTHTQEALPPPQTRVTNTVRETLAVCPFPLPETLPYPCSTSLRESLTSNRIVFASGKVVHNDTNTWLANLDGSDVVYLDTIPSHPNDVLWSSNDQWLLIGAYAAIDHSNVYYLVSADGAFVESLEDLTNTNHWRVQGVRPQFSPDGQKVAFVGIETGGQRLTAQQQDNEEAYNLYVLDLSTLEYQPVSTRFGSFQWSADGNGLYILDGGANTVGNRDSHGLKYANFYYLDLTQEGYPEQKLVGDIPMDLPYVGTWAYSPETRIMAGKFVIDGQGPVFSLLFLP